VVRDGRGEVGLVAVVVLVVFLCWGVWCGDGGGSGVIGPYEEEE
jgi:hypothetical protein